MADTIKLSTQFNNVKASTLYNAWLDSNKHSDMTGGKAKIGKKVGEKYYAWDKYISGVNLELIRYKRIVQSWRSTEFAKEDPSSILIIKFEENDKGTKLSIIQTEIPEGQGIRYKSGWKEHYFVPMKKYFNK